MYSFFTKVAKEIFSPLYIDFALLTVISGCVYKKLGQDQAEKEELKRMNPDMNVVAKPHYGRLGAVWSWSLEEKPTGSPMPVGFGSISSQHEINMPSQTIVKSNLDEEKIATPHM